MRTPRIALALIVAAACAHTLVRAQTLTGWWRVPGGEWVRHAVRYETSGYNANTTGDLLSLRPALYAAGSGEVRFRDFRYRALR